MFLGIQPSCIRSPPAKPRSTLIASSSTRSVLPDELRSFQELGLITFEDIKGKVSGHELIAFDEVDCVAIQSKEFVLGIPKYLIRIKSDMTFQTFHMGSLCSISTLISKKLHVVNIGPL